MRIDKPDVPNLTAVAGPEAPHEAPPAKTLVPVKQPKSDGPAPAEQPRERYWTEDRILRVGMMALYAFFVVGTVIALARWDLLDKAPFLPWLVGALAFAVPAFKGFAELAEEMKGRRSREETARTGFGVNVTAPRDRHAG